MFLKGRTVIKAMVAQLSTQIMAMARLVSGCEGPPARTNLLDIFKA